MSTGRATISIKLTGDAVGTPMIIYNNGQQLTTTEVGKTVNVNVVPFEKLSLSIAPKEDNALVSYDKEKTTFTLNPRMVKTMTYQVNKVLLVFGRLIDENGKPIAWQRLKGLHSTALTDQFGNFQAELTKNQVMYLQNNSYTCTVALPQVNHDNVYTYVGDLLCL